MNPKWQDAPITFIQMPACPACRSVEYTTIRSIGQGDGSRLQRRVCLGCAERYQIVWEPPLPDSGSDEFLTL